MILVYAKGEHEVSYLPFTGCSVLGVLNTNISKFIIFPKVMEVEGGLPQKDGSLTEPWFGRTKLVAIVARFR